MNPITNLAVNTVTLVNSATVIDFTFNKPAGIVGGYYLYYSSTGITYSFLSAKADVSHYKEEDISTYDDYYGKTHYSVTFSDIAYEGKVFYFYIQAVSTLLVASTSSGLISVQTFPSVPADMFCLYDGYEVDITWTDIDKTSGRNSSFTEYSIYTTPLTQIYGTTLTTTTLYNDSFIVGKAVWVIDLFKRSQWFGTVTTIGEIDLSLIKRTEYSDVSTSLNIDNFSIYIESDTEDFVGTSTSTGYVDINFISGTCYLYKLKTDTSGGRSSEYIKFPIFPLRVDMSYPYLRTVSNSSTGLLNNPYWETMKTVLIDKAYYDKSLYAIPYSSTETFNFKGYLGVSRCVVDIFLNNYYAFSTSTGQYGEFTFNYQFSKGNIDLQMQARDKLNKDFSRKSGTVSIRTFNIYTWFSALGNQYKQILDELALQAQDVSISLARYSSYVDRYQPLIDLFKVGAEDSTKFSTLAYEIFRMFEFVAYDEALYILLDALQETDDNFDHYEIYFNNRLFKTAQTGLTFTPRYKDRFDSTSTGLTRGNYFYGVTCLTSTGEETGASIIQADNRVWPLTYKGYNVIRWTPVPDITNYKIYRGVSSTGPFYYMNTIPNNVFVDNGKLVPDISKEPPIYDFTDYTYPSDTYLYIDTHYNKYEMFKKIPNWINIVIYANGSTDIKDYNIDRIIYYCKKIIAPELRYSIIYANDINVEYLT